MEIKLSVIILSKKEEKNIVDCIKSVSFSDEIIIVDDYSEDRTIEVVKNLHNRKVKIYKRKLLNDFSAQRNYGLEKARGEWILFVDADERVSLSLQFEISSLLSDSLSHFNGYYIERRDAMWGKELKHGETGNIKLLRLVKKGKGEWEGNVHEKWKVKGTIGKLRNSLLHYPHQTISEFLKEINFYTDLRAKELFEKNVKVYWWSIITYPLGKFTLNYGIRRGFLDGIQGFIFAITMSFHSFLVRGKLWQLCNRDK